MNKKIWRGKYNGIIIKACSISLALKWIKINQIKIKMKLAMVVYGCTPGIQEPEAEGLPGAWDQFGR